MSPESIRRQQGLYRRWLSMTPPGHRSRFGEEQVALFGDLLERGESPRRLWLLALPDLMRVFRENKEDLLNHSARLALAAVSLAPIILGVLVTVVIIDEFDDVPSLLPLVAMALIAQGGFTLLWLGGKLARWHRLATDTFIVGEVAALIAGAALVAGAVASQDPMDPEYAPIMIGVVVAAHASIGLLALLTARGETASG